MRSLTMTVRALRVSARDPMVFGVRAGLVALVVTALVVAVATRGAFGAPGLNFFRGLVTIDLAAIVALGLATFSTVITEEKRAGTLGLLSLAGFRPLSILLGKSVAQLVITLQLLVAQVPFAVLAVTLGGIAPRQVWAAYVILLAFAFFVYAIALLSSALGRNDAVAARTTGLLLAAVLGLPWLGATLLRLAIAGGHIAAKSPVATGLESVLGGLGSLSVLPDLFRVFESGFAGRLVPGCVLWDCGVAVVCVALAWSLFPQQEQREPARRPAVPGRAGVGAERPGTRSTALAWKDFHFVAGGTAGRRRRWVGYGLACFVLFFLVDQPGFSRSQWFVAWGGAVAGFHALAIVVEAGLVAGRILRIEVQDQTLLGLALLPARLSSSANEKLRGSLGVIRVPIFFLIIGIVASVLGTGALSFMFAACIGLVFVAFVYVSFLMFVVQLTVYLSLWLRRGAFFVAAGAIAVLYALLTTALGAAGVAFLSFVILPGGMLLVSVLLQLLVGERLRAMASE